MRWVSQQPKAIYGHASSPYRAEYLFQVHFKNTNHSEHGVTQRFRCDPLRPPWFKLTYPIRVNPCNLWQNKTHAAPAASIRIQFIRGISVIPAYRQAGVANLHFASAKSSVLIRVIRGKTKPMLRQQHQSVFNPLKCFRGKLTFRFCGIICVNPCNLWQNKTHAAPAASIRIQSFKVLSWQTHIPLLRNHLC